MEICFYPFGKIKNEQLDFAVISTSFHGKGVYVRQWERETWEIPGGHREPDEDIRLTALRELYEETGGVCESVDPVCHYSVTIGETTRFGGLFHADINEMGPLPESEIGEVILSKDMPENLTYPEIQPILHRKVLDHLCQKAERLLCMDRERNMNILNFIHHYPVKTIDIAGNSILVRGKSDENWVYISSASADELHRLMKGLDEKDKCFAALEDWMLPHIIGTRKVHSGLSSIKLVYDESYPVPPVSSEIVQLIPEMAPTIFEHSKYKEFLCVEYIEERIRNGIGLGVLHEGRLAAWAITHDDGAIGFLHVLEEFRGKGYALDVTRTMIKKLLETGQVPFVHIEESNIPSMNLALKAGFKKYGRIHWIYL